MYIYWILLGLAIATEITGTLSMKWASVSEGNGGFILMLVMISLSYIFLSFAVKKIALGVAYALWEGIGILFITLFICFIVALSSFLFEWVHAAWLALAIVLEIVANVFLKFSDGFRRKIFGLLSLAAVLAAFSALSQAVKGIDLSVAYALWGGFGIAATLAAGWILFGQRLNRKGWIGLVLLLAGMIMVKLA